MLWRVIFVLYAMIIVTADLTKAVTVTSTVTFSNGLYSYDYSLNNDSTTSLVSFGLELPASVITVDLTSPPGWDSDSFTLGGILFVFWVSSDFPFNLPPFATLDGFGFDSSSPSGNVTFSGLDENFSGFDGQTIGPVNAVPEPSTWLLLVTGLVGLVSHSWRRKK